jgi:hypothetical protein
MMLLVPIPWAARVCALPFLTALCPSGRYYDSQGKQSKKLTDWARQMVKQVHRWLPNRPIVIVADSEFAALDFLGTVRRHATVITRLRLDAAPYAPAPECLPGQLGRKRLKGERLTALGEVLADQATSWTALTVPCWYGEPSVTIGPSIGRGTNSSIRAAPWPRQYPVQWRRSSSVKRIRAIAT